jgi:endonuclease YncB( thermonuclease family)
MQAGKTAGFTPAGFFGYTLIAMSPVIPFRGRSSVPSLLIGVIAVAVIGFAATFLNWQSSPQQTSVVVLRPDPGPNPAQSGRIDVIDGDTVRLNGERYRLVGFDTPEVGDKARCDDERRRADAATTRLRALIDSGDARLVRVACACRPGQEGTRNCNYGRLCGSLSIGGRDVGAILIGEGFAHSYVCGATSCPPRRPWC